MDQTLVYLSQISENLEYADYNMIYQSIADMRNKPMPIAIIPAGSFIDRVRINKPGEIFSTENSVSYIKDQQVLQARQELGRVNLPSQAMFYGSVISTLVQLPRAVAYFETSELFEDKEKFNLMENIEEVFTHSRWRLIEDIEVAEMIYSEQALKVNPDVRAALESQEQGIKQHEQKEHFEQQLKFFSDQFARVKKYTHHEYKISCAYSNYILSNTPLSGIAYPSVASEYKGQNIALKPEVVDKSLRLESIGMSLFKRENFINKPIVCFKIATDLGEGNNNFDWIDTPASI